MLTRTQYNEARKQLRENGISATRSMAQAARSVIERLYMQREDRLAERANIVAYCKSVGVTCTVRQTA